MTNEALFQRFVERTPVTVMMRSTLDFCLTPDKLDQIFANAAVRQRPSELLFSSVVELLAMVVWRQRDSVRVAYTHAKKEFEVSVRSVYNKLNGTETQVCRALVRDTVADLQQLVEALGTRRKPLLEGYRIRILDGNHLTSTDHRLKVLRRTKSGPLPGQVLAVLDPDRMLIVDLFPCEDGEAQERRILPEVLEAVERNDLWIGDRNFCTTGFLFGLAKRLGYFVIRQHASTLQWEKETKLKRVGRCETGVMFEQKLYLQQGEEILIVRRIVIKLDEPTRDGATEIRLLTNLSESIGGKRIAKLYLKRWTIENAFQELEQALRSEINTLGYPGAALLGFSIAALTYNTLSLSKWAIAAEHKATIEYEQLSSYYLAGAIAADYGGMMIALPEEEWTKRFGKMTLDQFVQHLRACAKHVRPNDFKKNVRGPKKPRPPRTSGKINHHVSTAQLLADSKKC
jgi:hypothetical protein